MTTRNDYVRELFAREDEVLTAVRRSIESRGMPPISVAPETGTLLTLLVKMTGARRVLEIGALGGYSAICLARGLSGDGTLLSLERNAAYAAFAEENVKAAGLGEKVTFRVGMALESLRALQKEGASFDFFFIDADKENVWNYLEWAIRLSRKQAVITVDNVLWKDQVLDPDNREDTAVIMRNFNRQLAGDSRLEAFLIPIGDGLAVARVK
jgi:caffeoyl-CoA O-methyltransferase